MTQNQPQSPYLNYHNKTRQCNPLIIVINIKTSTLFNNNKEYQVLEGYPFINIVTSVYNQIILF